MSSPNGTPGKRITPSGLLLDSLDGIELVETKSGRRTIRVAKEQVEEFVGSLSRQGIHSRGNNSRERLQDSPYLQPWELEREHIQQKKKVSKKTSKKFHATSDDDINPDFDSTEEEPSSSKRSRNKSAFGHLTPKTSSRSNSIGPKKQSGPQKTYAYYDKPHSSGGHSVRTPSQLLDVVRKSMYKMSTLQEPIPPPSLSPKTSKSLSTVKESHKTPLQLLNEVRRSLDRISTHKELLNPNNPKSSTSSRTSKPLVPPVTPPQHSRPSKAPRTSGTLPSSITSPTNPSAGVPISVPLTSLASATSTSEGTLLTLMTLDNPLRSSSTEHESSQTDDLDSEYCDPWTLLYILTLLVLIISGILLYVTLVQRPPPLSALFLPPSP